ncbi:hypothetical protein B0A50_07054 [Salinomyces thailandicus]|uniref:Aminoglycoside phosphotransferase domain-containing protein n=1 Tax=Salinomyces thailandicus TaxID=706561 RepID=A0A4U0TPP5_9PEZI|nr:hypothetical protein B0A50_07054 [Salinomyces thailandica]
MEAYRVYSPLTPTTRDFGRVTVGDGVVLQAVEMSCIPGTRFSEFQPRTPWLDPDTVKRYKRLLRNVATFFARSWYGGRTSSPALERCTGKVGRSILFRLEALERYLPSRALRVKARVTRQGVEQGGLDATPVVLTHGDFLPSNIMVEPVSWTVEGYVDWAEAEHLPTGMCLYGLEYLLGYVESGCGERVRSRFVYYEQVDELREAFWTALEEQVPAICHEDARRALELSCDVGILLWKGFAWDDGAIDRVVSPESDADEVACLEAWLVEKPNGSRHSSPSDDSPRSLFSTTLCGAWA